MKKTLLCLVGVLLLFLLPGCRKPPSSLRIAVDADRISPEVVRRFEQEWNCRVDIVTGGQEADLLFVGTEEVARLQRKGKLHGIWRDDTRNLSHVDPEFLRSSPDRKMRHSVPYLIEVTGITYDREGVENIEASWRMFDRGDLAGRMTMLGDMREVIGAALKSIGFSANTRDDRELAAARGVLMGWKKNLAGLARVPGGFPRKDGVVLAQARGGDVLKSQVSEAGIAFLLPAEGCLVSCEYMVMSRKTENVPLAHAFINFLHDPEVAAQNSEFTSCRCPNVPSYRLLSRELRNSPALFLPPEIKAKSELIMDLGEDNEKYRSIWAEFDPSA